MNKRKKMVSILAGIMAAVMLLTLILSLIPVPAHAASSSEIRSQINQLQAQKAEIQKQIEDVKEQYEENEDEIANIISQKAVIDQEVQLLSMEIANINEQIAAFNILIADKQDELDAAEGVYLKLNEENKVRVRAMEEEGALSYWEVLFKANTFSDLLDRLSMVEEIAAADAKHLKEMSEAAEAVELAQNELESEKKDLEYTKAELDATQFALDEKRAEADTLFQELLVKADDLEALEAEFEAQRNEYVNQILSKEREYEAAKYAEYMATYVPPTQAPVYSGSGDGSAGATNSGGWVNPVNGSGTLAGSPVTSPYGNRESPTAGASTNHQGMDIDGRTGDPVYAAKAGVVVKAGYSGAAGNMVRIQHDGGYTTEYMHLQTYSVSVGQTVSAGQKIGTMGATGVATGDHLHFGVSQNGVYVNPGTLY